MFFIKLAITQKYENHVFILKVEDGLIPFL